MSTFEHSQDSAFGARKALAYSDLPYLSLPRHMAGRRWGFMMGSRNSSSFRERLSAVAEDERKKAVLLPLGPDKDASLRKILQVETAFQLDGWTNSPGLRPTK